MASLTVDSKYGETDIDYSLVDGRIRSAVVYGEKLYDEDEGFAADGWRRKLWLFVLAHRLNVADHRGLHAFVRPLIEEFADKNS